MMEMEVNVQWQRMSVCITTYATLFLRRSNRLTNFKPTLLRLVLFTPSLNLMTHILFVKH